MSLSGSKGITYTPSVAYANRRSANGLYSLVRKRLVGVSKYAFTMLMTRACGSSTPENCPHFFDAGVSNSFAPHHGPSGAPSPADAGWCPALPHVSPATHRSSISVDSHPCMHGIHASVSAQPDSYAPIGTLRSAHSNRHADPHTPIRSGYGRASCSRYCERSHSSTLICSIPLSLYVPASRVRRTFR